MDYARGGGSSGARLNDGGASGENDGGAVRADTCGARVADVTLTATGAQGAIVWQPFGAHGNRQGDCCSPWCAGADDVRSEPGIIIPAIVSAEAADDVVRHA